MYAIVEKLLQLTITSQSGDNSISLLVAVTPANPNLTYRFPVACNRTNLALFPEESLGIAILAEPTPDVTVFPVAPTW